MSYGHNKKTKKQAGWNVKEPVKRPDDNPRQRVDLKPEDFDRLIDQKGVHLKVYRTLYCPNVKSVDAGEHEINCTMCNGSGFIDLDPICTKGVIVNQDLEKTATSNTGYHDGNSVMCSFPIGIELQYFTRVELEDYTDIYFQRVLRKEGTVIDILKYRACRVNSVVDKNNVRYYQDQDFTIEMNGNIKWGARKPADGLVYSIHYECKVQFRAVKAIHVNRFTQYRSQGLVEQIKMPEQWMLTKEFLLRRKDINTGGDLLEGPFDSHEDTTGDNE